MGMESQLFAGNELPGGGLSNASDLIDECPQEFKNGNAWTKYASILFSGKINFFSWEWISGNASERDQQTRCLHGILSSTLSPVYKRAIAGWMLSKMLKKLPENSSLGFFEKLANLFQ